MDPLTLAIIVVAAWRGARGAVRESRTARRAAREQRLLAAAAHGKKHTDPASFATRAGTVLGDILATPAAVAAGVRGFRRGLSYGRHHRRDMRATRAARRAAKTGMTIGLGGGKLAGAATVAAGVGARGAFRGAAAGFRYGRATATGMRRPSATAMPGDPVASDATADEATAEVVEAELVEDEATGNGNTEGNEATPAGNTGATAIPALGQATPGNAGNGAPEATEDGNDWQPCPACGGHDAAVDVAGCRLCGGTGNVPGAFLAAILDTPYEPSAAERATAPAGVAAAELTLTTGDTTMPGTSLTPAGASLALVAEGGIVTYDEHLANLRALIVKARDEHASAEMVHTYAGNAKKRAEADVAAIELITAGIGAGGADFGAPHETAMSEIQELITQQAAYAAQVEKTAAASMELAALIVGRSVAAGNAFVAAHQGLAEAHAAAPHAGRREGYQPQ